MKFNNQNLLQNEFRATDLKISKVLEDIIFQVSIIPILFIKLSSILVMLLLALLLFYIMKTTNSALNL